MEMTTVQQYPCFLLPICPELETWSLLIQGAKSLFYPQNDTLYFQIGNVA